MPRRGDTKTVNGMRPCAGPCKQTKPEADFILMARHGKREGQVVRSPYCDDCRRGYHRDYANKRELREPGYKKATARKAVLSKYGLTPEEYDEMFAAQDGKCAVCGREPGETKGVDRHNLVVDHDHAIGTKRELLCDFCNRGLGIFRDDPDLLIAAAMYLLKHSAQEEGG